MTQADFNLAFITLIFIPAGILLLYIFHANFLVPYHTYFLKHFLFGKCFLLPFLKVPLFLYDVVNYNCQILNLFFMAFNILHHEEICL